MPSTGNLGVDSDAATWKSPAYGAGLGNHLPIGYWGSAQYRSAIRFLQPAGWTGWTDIASATLTIYTSDFQHVGVRNSQIYCRRVANSAMWTRGAGSTSCESGFSAANSTQYTDIGPVATDQIQFSSGTTANKAITLDVTAMVKYYWQNNSSRIVFVFDPVGSSDYTELWSTEHSTPNITLNISYLVQSPPVAPALTAPAAGSAQATQTPTFSWNHSDPQGDPQASAQVRVWDATGTTQVGTTQTVTGTAGSLVWPTALPRGVSYMWDVATADAANGYGPFSAKQAFSVKPNPTVTIDATRYMSYSGGAPRLTVKWTVGSGTQYKYRVTAPGYDSGLLTSTATSHLLSTLGLTNGTAVPITVYVETSDPLNGSQTVSFTPRWGQTVHRRDLTAAPTGWGTPTVTQTVPSGASLIIEYGSSATATAAPSPNTWYSTLSGVPKARYVFYRATFIPSATAGPTLDKIVIPSSASVQVVDQWAANLGGPFILNAAGGYDIDTGEYVYGSRSLHCTVPGAGPYTMFSAPIQVRAGRSYILTGLMKSVGNSGAQFRLADSTGATLTNPDGTAIASIISKGPPLVQAISGDAEWFTPDQRDVNRYATPVWVSPSDQTVYVVLRAGNVAGAQCWWDGIKLEESSVATPWAPAAVGATVVDAGGVQIDGSAGGILRYRGTVGGLRDVVDGGANGLRFGGDSNLWSPIQGHLQTDAFIDTPRGFILPGSMGSADLRNLVPNPGFETRDPTSSCNCRGWIASNAAPRADAHIVYTRSGQASLQVAVGGTQTYVTSDRFPVDGLTDYLIGAWGCGYGPNGDATAKVGISVRWYDYLGNSVGADSGFPAVTTGQYQGWVPLNPAQALVTAPKTAVSAMFIFTMPPASAGTLYLDDVSMVEATQFAAPMQRSLWLPLNAALLDGTTLITTGASPNLQQAINYPDAATASAGWVFQVPSDFIANAPWSVGVSWTPAASDAAAHAVRWNAAFRNVSSGVDVTGSMTSGFWTGAAAARTVNISAADGSQDLSAVVVPMTAGSRMRLLLQRIGADAADTYVGAVRVYNVGINYSASR